jgi:hypothetical protein
MLFSDQYNFILQSAGKLLSPTVLNLFKFSLSIRYYSPTIELFNQVQCSDFFIHCLYTRSTKSM